VTVDELRLFKCRLIPDDFLFFVSKEFNTLTSIDPVIHNYALTYALADQFHIMVKGYEPNYDELETFDNYATPAVPNDTPRFVTHTYNSICTKTNQTQSNYNVPAMGRNRKIAPQSSTFEFLVFSREGDIPPYARVGKKSCISQIESRELEIESIESEPEQPIQTGVCFNLLDLSANDIVDSADMTMMFPTPVAMSMEVTAPHIVFAHDEERTMVPIPKHLRGEAN
jgi:CRISPR-associated protein Csc1